MAHELTHRSIARAVGRVPALRVPNFRRYLLGQGASIAGTWLQTVALAWLVFRLTDSGASVGIVTAAQFVPALALGAWAGSLADRYDARRAVLVLQVLLFAQAASLTLLVATHHETMWWLCGLAAVQGVGNAFDPPIRQGLMNDLVGDHDLASAVSLNSTIVQLGMVVGPSLGAVLLPTVGLAWCFAVNASSYVAMFLAIRSIRPAEMLHRPRATGAAASVRSGVAHIRGRRDVQLLLVAVGVASLVAYRLEVIVPLLARREFAGGSGLFSVMTVVRGVGSLVGSLWLTTRRAAPTHRLLGRSCGFQAAALAAMTVPVRGVVLVALALAGGGMLVSMISTLSMVQLATTSEFRGRVVAIWFVVMNGGVVVGAPLTGWIAEHFGVPTVVTIASASMFALSAYVAMPGGRRDPVPAAVPLSDR